MLFNYKLLEYEQSQYKLTLLTDSYRRYCDVSLATQNVVAEHYRTMFFDAYLREPVRIRQAIFPKEDLYAQHVESLQKCTAAFI